jgi:hypothetical protein
MPPTKCSDWVVSTIIVIRVLRGLNLGPEPGYPDLRFSFFSQFIQENAGYCHFLPCPVRFIIHQSSYHSTLYCIIRATDTVFK